MVSGFCKRGRGAAPGGERGEAGVVVVDVIEALRMNLVG